MTSPFSRHAERRNWRDLEDFFNPGRTFSRVHIVSVGDDADFTDDEFGTLKLHPIRPFPWPGAPKVLRNAYVMAVATWRLFRLTRAAHVDVIAQVFGGPLKYGLPAVLVARYAGLPSIITLHNDYPNLMRWTYPAGLRWIGMLVWRYLFLNSTHIRSVSEYIAQFAYSHGVATDKVSVIPNKEDLAKFQEPPSIEEIRATSGKCGLSELGRNAVAFLTVGRFIPAKNLETMLVAFARAARANSNIHYLLCGDGPLRERLEIQAGGLGIEDQVHFLGFLPHDDLRCIYHLSDVFLFVTHYEGQPRVIVEAMLAGLPIVCANYGQVCELVADGVDGIWAEPNDVAAIEMAIASLASDGAFRDRMAKHENFDPDVFSIPRVSEQEAALYRRVLEERCDRREPRVPAC